MAEVLTVANQKGGVGKTTTALCIATGLMNRGKKVLFVDVDPQRNSTQFYGAETDGVKTMYDFYMDKCSIKEAIQNTKMGDIVPCDKLLKGMEGFFTNGTNPYRNFIRLKKSLEEVKVITILLSLIHLQILDIICLQRLLLQIKLLFRFYQIVFQ